MILVSNIGKRSIARFSQKLKQVKTIKNYLKTKRIEESIDVSQITKQDKEVMQNSHRMLYVPYMPIVLLAVPCAYFFSTPASIDFLHSCNILQYYSSGILCFNSFFSKEDYKKYLAFLACVASINCISGPLSIASPILLGLMNFYYPFTDEKAHRIESQSQQESTKTFMGVQALFYFFIVVITTLKTYHFLTIKQMEQKIKALQTQNKMHFSTLETTSQK